MKYITSTNVPDDVSTTHPTSSDSNSEIMFAWRARRQQEREFGPFDVALHVAAIVENLAECSRTLVRFVTPLAS